MTDVSSLVSTKTPKLSIKLSLPGHSSHFTVEKGAQQRQKGGTVGKSTVLTLGELEKSGFESSIHQLNVK